MLSVLHAPEAESSPALAVLAQVAEISALEGNISYQSGQLDTIEAGRADSHRAPRGTSGAVEED